MHTCKVTKMVTDSGFNSPYLLRSKHENKCVSVKWFVGGIRGATTFAQVRLGRIGIFL